MPTEVEQLGNSPPPGEKQSEILIPGMPALVMSKEGTSAIINAPGWGLCV